VPDDDALAAYWRVYFTSIFNPARLKISAMTSEMPRKYWKNLPEADAIPELIRTARERETRMVEQPIISPDRPRPQRETVQTPKAPFAAAAEAARHCQNCALWVDATQTVFGEGDVHAQIMLIGEQPGDQEDLAGRPFVGPAGQLLDRALSEAKLDRSKLYVTNAVKHFKFILRGKRRIHQKPGNTEIVACRQWLETERNMVQPLITVLMGATAAQAVLGRSVTISRERGRSFGLGASRGFITVHPSYLLRLPEPEARAREYAAFVEDLRAVKLLLASGAPLA
jgi:DNA polymerase